MYSADIAMDLAAQTQSADFNLSRTALRWFGDSFRYRGILPTFGIFVVRLMEFARDFTPARRRLRYGDLQFDFEHGVDTTWSNITWRTRLRELFSGEPYQPIEPEQFHEMLGSLNIDYSEFSFVDLGSGKGRALLLASSYPFRRIIGVEVLPELHAIAQRNLSRFHDAHQRCTRLESWCGDARDFVLPEDPIVLYLFNPFFEPVLERVLKNVEDSVRRNPRKFVLIYANPLSEHVMARFKMLRKVRGTHQYSFFDVRPTAR